MKVKRFHPKMFIILFIFWMLLTLNLEISNIIGGIIVSFIVTYLSYGLLYTESGFLFSFPSIYTWIKYIFILISEIYISSIDLMKSIIKDEYNPSILEIDLDLKDSFLITLVANSITLTPGTITVDKKDNKLIVLYIRQDENGDAEKNIKEKFEKLFIKKEN